MDKPRSEEFRMVSNVIESVRIGAEFPSRRVRKLYTDTYVYDGRTENDGYERDRTTGKIDFIRRVLNFVVIVFF